MLQHDSMMLLIAHLNCWLMLALTCRDLERSLTGSESRAGATGRKRRRKRQTLTGSIVLLLALIALLGTLLFMYSRLLPHLPALQ